MLSAYARRSAVMAFRSSAPMYLRMSLAALGTKAATEIDVVEKMALKKHW